MASRRVAALTIFSGAAVATAALFANAQSLEPSDWVESVWVAESEGLLRVRTSDGTLLSEDGSASDMRVLAVDPVRGWSLDTGRSRACGGSRSTGPCSRTSTCPFHSITE